jgi:N-acetylmuramoyl-L-alanine amidase
MVLLALILLIGLLGFLLVKPDKVIITQGEAPPREIYVPIVDAGHGGEDGGTESRSGNWESRINLDIAVKTNLLLRFFGYHTVMTREDDISLHDAGMGTIRDKKVSDLKNRVKKINSVDNGALISIHQNYFEQSRYHGAQTFYHGSANGAFAAAMQNALRRTLDPANERGCKPTNTVYVLNRIQKPAVLVECGFLSNPTEEALLLTAGYQRKVALAVCLGFMDWSRAKR